MTHDGGLAVLWDDELRTEREPAKEPSKRWRNWYRAKLACDVCAPNQTLSMEPGGVFYGSPHPSKEIAEQRAFDEMASNGENARAIEYRGAFPEGEQPNNT